MTSTPTEDELFVEVVKKTWENMSAAVGKIGEDFNKLQRKRVPYSEMDGNFNVEISSIDHLYDLSMDEVCQLYQQEKISNANKARSNDMLTRRKNELEDRIAVAETICTAQKNLIIRLNDTLGEMFKSLSEHESSRIQKAREWKNKVTSLEGTVAFFTKENGEMRDKIQQLMDTQWKKDKELLECNNKLMNEENEKRSLKAEYDKLMMNHKTLQDDKENLQARYDESVRRNNDMNQASSKIREEMQNISEELRLAQERIDIEKQTCLNVVESKEIEFERKLNAEKENIEREANRQMSSLQKRHSEEISRLRTDIDRILNEAKLNEDALVKERNILARRLAECEDILENHEKRFNQKFQRKLANKYCEIVSDLQQCNLPKPKIDTARSVPSRYAETCLNELRGEPLSRPGTSSSKENERREKLREIFHQVIEPKMPSRGIQKRSSSATTNIRK